MNNGLCILGKRESNGLCSQTKRGQHWGGGDTRVQTKIDRMNFISARPGHERPTVLKSGQN